MINTLTTWWSELGTGARWLLIIGGWLIAASVVGVFIGKMIGLGRHPMADQEVPSHIYPEAGHTRAERHRWIMANLDARGMTEQRATVIEPDQDFTDTEARVAELMSDLAGLPAGGIRPAHNGKPTLVSTADGWTRPSPRPRNES